MNTQEFKLRGEYVALCDLLKITGIADSGGQGKLMIANGEVTVDGQPESRKTAKIRAGQTVTCLGQTDRVLAAWGLKKAEEKTASIKLHRQPRATIQRIVLPPYTLRRSGCPPTIVHRIPMNLLLFALGLASLVAGASLLVRGASKLALSLGISPLVVGLTIVAFGTSAPEVAVSVGAVLDGKTDLAIGNVVGSNIFNVLFILGVSALITPLVVNIQLVRQEVPIMIGASLLLLLLGLDGTLGLWDCAFLFGLLIAYTVFLVRQSRRDSSQAQAEYAEDFQSVRSSAWDAKVPVQIVLIVVGLVAWTVCTSMPAAP